MTETDEGRKFAVVGGEGRIVHVHAASIGMEFSEFKCPNSVIAPPCDRIINPTMVST